MLETMTETQEGLALLALVMYVGWHALVTRRLRGGDQIDLDAHNSETSSEDEVAVSKTTKERPRDASPR